MFRKPSIELRLDSEEDGECVLEEQTDSDMYQFWRRSLGKDTNSPPKKNGSKLAEPKESGKGGLKSASHSVVSSEATDTIESASFDNNNYTKDEPTNNENDDNKSKKFVFGIRRLFGLSKSSKKGADGSSSQKGSSKLKSKAAKLERTLSESSLHAERLSSFVYDEIDALHRHVSLRGLNALKIGRYDLKPCRPLVVWNTKISDYKLVFSNNNTIATRKAEIANYPASLIEVPVDMTATFSATLLLQTAPNINNNMTIGIADHGFKSSGSTGFGKTAYSWGLVDYRSNASDPCRIFSDGDNLASFRKMKAGDVYSIVYDRSLGKAWILVANLPSDLLDSNENELMALVDDLEVEMCFVFDVHSPGDDIDIVMGATFCNDHELCILPVQPLRWRSGLPDPSPSVPIVESPRSKESEYVLASQSGRFDYDPTSKETKVSPLLLPAAGTSTAAAPVSADPTAWSILTHPDKSTDPAAMAQELAALAITSDYELRCCTTDQISRLVGLLKPVPRVAVLKLLTPPPASDRRSQRATDLSDAASKDELAKLNSAIIQLRKELDAAVGMLRQLTAAQASATNEANPNPANTTGTDTVIASKADTSTLVEPDENDVTDEVDEGLSEDEVVQNAAAMPVSPADEENGHW